MLYKLSQIAILLLIFACCVGGVWAQFKAKKHIKPGHAWALRKDSLLQRRAMAYDEKGMYYVRIQKILLFIMLCGFLILAFFFKNTP